MYKKQRRTADLHLCFRICSLLVSGAAVQLCVIFKELIVLLLFKP